jgi:hypothetical protein
MTVLDSAVSDLNGSLPSELGLLAAMDDGWE